MSSPLSEPTGVKVHAMSDDELIDRAIRDIMALPDPEKRIERARRVLRSTNVSALELADAILRKEKDLGR